jgi:hypothetical protein
VVPGTLPPLTFLDGTAILDTVRLLFRQSRAKTIEADASPTALRANDRHEW